LYCILNPANDFNLKLLGKKSQVRQQEKYFFFCVRKLRMLRIYCKYHYRKMKKITLTIILCLAGAVALFAQGPIRKKHFNLKNALPIEGYYPIAYIKKNKAVEGKKDIAENFHGATYYFSSAANKDAFKANPPMYEPQYGGWCAYAMGAIGEKVNIDP